MKCPHCQSEEIKKNGFVFGIQRYQCKKCGFQFTKTSPHGKEGKEKASALSLCHLGVSAHQVAKILETTPTSVGRWIKDFPKNIPYIFTQENKINEVEETTLKSYIRKLYIENKKNFWMSTQKFPSGYEVDILVKDRRIPPKKASKKLVVCGLGDSILEGVIHNAQTNRYHILPENFVALSGKKLNVEWKNFARMGSTVLDGKEQLESHLRQINDCDYILLSFGANDCNHNWEEISRYPNKQHHPKLELSVFHKKYVELIQRIQKMGKMPVLLSLVPVASQGIFNARCQGRNKQNILKFLRGDIENIYRWVSMYNLEVFKVAQETNVPVINITSCFLKELDYTKFLCDDGVHPNALGHELIAKALDDFYKEYFK